MWVADIVDTDGTRKPLMNDLSGWRSYEPTEEMMRWKCDELNRIKPTMFEMP